jgi:hypothetical protein
VITDAIAAYRSTGARLGIPEALTYLAKAHSGWAETLIALSCIGEALCFGVITPRPAPQSPRLPAGAARRWVGHPAAPRRGRPSLVTGSGAAALHENAVEWRLVAPKTAFSRWESPWRALRRGR